MIMKCYDYLYELHLVSLFLIYIIKAGVCLQTKHWIALDFKHKGLFGFIWATFQLLVKSTYINVLSALKWQSSLNSSLNGKIKVDSVNS